ncbi:MAG: alpha/beta fold hydrolase [Anaerolineales bacterium]|nr:alpha/beta fold hydrolase [Anaerolineales bacterium]
MPSSPTILLHGLGLTRRSMEPLARKLASHGFQTLNLDYPSRKFLLETLAGHVWADLQTHFGASPPPLNFVSHSMGGIVLRVLARDFPVQIARAVMFAPPNQGSEWADLVPRVGLGKVMGPAALQVGTSSDSLPNQLGAVNFPLGVIAGRVPDNPLAPFIFSGPNDGRVSVARTKVAGMADHVTFPAGHFFLRYLPGVVRQTVAFLERGEFI